VSNTKKSENISDELNMRINSSINITGNGNVVSGGTGNCIHGNGDLKIENREIRNFTGIMIQGSIDVVHRASTGPSLKLTVDSNLAELITTEVVGNNLVVSSLGSYSTSNKIIIECGSNYVTRVNINGSGDVKLENVSNNGLDISINGSGDVEATGVVKKLDVRIQGSGDVDLSDLSSEFAAFFVNGSGDIRANVSKEINAQISGSGDIRIKGNPEVRNIKENGSGSIKFK